MMEQLLWSDPQIDEEDLERSIDEIMMDSSNESTEEENNESSNEISESNDNIEIIKKKIKQKWKSSKRGAGIEFGVDITENFVNKNNLEYVIRVKFFLFLNF